MKSKTINWTVERRKISDLTAHPKNPRNFTQKGMKDLEKSINKIGMAQPINITKDNVILSGHARILKLQEMGIDEVDVYVPNVELTDKQQDEVIVRMNANTAGEWDFEKLANEFDLSELEDWGLELPELEDFEEKEDVSIDDDVKIKKVDIVISCDQLDLIEIINDIEKIKKNYKNFKIKIDESL